MLAEAAHKISNVYVGTNLIILKGYGDSGVKVDHSVFSSYAAEVQKACVCTTKWLDVSTMTPHTYNFTLRSMIERECSSCVGPVLLPCSSVQPIVLSSHELTVKTSH